MMLVSGYMFVLEIPQWILIIFQNLFFKGSDYFKISNIDAYVRQSKRWN